MAYSISRGAKAKPVRACVYGPEGCGKTTFAAQWPGAVIVDVEDGSGHYDVARLDKPATWGELLDQVVWCAHNPEVGTVVVDTADAAEALCIAHVCREKNLDGIESAGYGKGYTYLAEEFRKLMECLDACAAEGKNVLVVAHAQIRKFEQPDEMGAYDRWELKLSKKCAPLVKEWCDLLLFANYKTTMVKGEDGKYRSTGGKQRVMYASHTAAYDAKNRLGLPDEMPFEFAQVAGKVPECAPTVIEGGRIEQPATRVGKTVVAGVEFTDATPPEVVQLHGLMQRDGITQEQVQRAVGEGQNNPYTAQTTFGEYDVAFIREVLLAHWGEIAGSIRERAEYDKPVPFD